MVRFVGFKVYTVYRVSWCTILVHFRGVYYTERKQMSEYSFILYILV